MKSKKTGLLVAGTIFGIVCFLHLLRLITGVHIEIDGCHIPVWMSGFGLIGTGLLSGWLLWLALQHSHR